MAFMSKMRFEGNSSQSHEPPVPSEVSQAPKESSFCINVVGSQDDLKTSSLETLLESSSCCLLFFNDDVDRTEEPKIVFATDHSHEANKNLSLFRRLKPAGFGGAVVISEADSSNLGTSRHETSRTFLERTKSAAHSTQANLIIANIDLAKFGEKSMQMSNLVKMVLQNKCHVLILKSY